MKQNDTDVFDQIPYGDDGSDDSELFGSGTDGTYDTHSGTAQTIDRVGEEDDGTDDDDDIDISYHSVNYTGEYVDKVLSDDNRIDGATFASRVFGDTESVDLDSVLDKTGATTGPMIPRDSAFQALKDALPDIFNGVGFVCIGVSLFLFIYLTSFHPKLVFYRANGYDRKNGLITDGFVLAIQLILILYGIVLIIKAWPKPGEIFFNAELARRKYELRRLCSQQDDIKSTVDKWGDTYYSRCSHDVRAFRFPASALPTAITVTAQREDHRYEPSQFERRQRSSSQKSGIVLDREGVQLCIAQASSEGLRLFLVDDGNLGIEAGISTKQHSIYIDTQQEAMNAKLGIFRGKSGKSKHDSLTNFVVLQRGGKTRVTKPNGTK